MNQLKILKFLLPAIFAGFFLTLPQTSKATGIPVIDGALNAITHKLGIEKIAKMMVQINNQVQQIEQLKAQVSALTGSRNMGDLLKNVVKDEIPDEWKSIYNNANANYKNWKNGKSYNPEDALKQLANDNDLSTKAFNDTKQRLTNIQNLMSQIDKTQDLKGSADLQNRIAAEQAIIQNNQTKLDMMDRLERQQEKIEYAKYENREACAARHMADENYDECH